MCFFESLDADNFSLKHFLQRFDSVTRINYQLLLALFFVTFSKMSRDWDVVTINSHRCGLCGQKAGAPSNNTAVIQSACKARSGPVIGLLCLKSSNKTSRMRNQLASPRNKSYGGPTAACSDWRIAWHYSGALPVYLSPNKSRCAQRINVKKWLARTAQFDQWAACVSKDKQRKTKRSTWPSSPFFSLRLSDCAVFLW